NIPPGRSFDQVIEEALTMAKCVIVLWSKASVASDWVKVEAADAAKRHILIPALIDHVTIPLEFRRLQAADLVGWQGASQHAGMQLLLNSIAGICPASTVSK
ncbi:MAG TPA: toll/interleukin-1 receptor domain-containing protein, partial [Candidatus Angelobacter sp.]